jgi:hypothetical protein
VPALILLPDKEPEAYDFIKWYVLNGQKAQGDVKGLPFLDVKVQMLHLLDQAQS